MVKAMENNGAKALDPYLQKFERFERETKQPSWLFPLRKAGLAHFAELGFPTLQHEDWRFTNVAPITKLPFKPVFQLSGNGITPKIISGYTFGTISATRLVFLNGHYSAALSSPSARQSGVVVTSLASALTANSGLLEKYLGR